MTALFPFVQFEFSHSIGPPPGRYLVGNGPVGEETAPTGEDDPAAKLGRADVLVVRVEGARASRARRVGSRRARPQAVPEPSRELAVTLVTVIKGTRLLDGPDSAERLLADIHGSADEQERWVDDALAIVNRAVAAYRLSAVDPYAIEVSRADPHAVRIGHGPAAALTRGGWDAAFSVPPRPEPRVDRAVRLMPTQGMAAILAGRSRMLEAEDLVLRVVLDLEQGRGRAAAAGLHAAHGLLIAELGEEPMSPSARERFDRVIRAGGAIAELAERARAAALGPEDSRRLGQLAEEVGGLVDAWRYQ